MKKKKFVILCLVVLIVGYLKVTAMPLYSNRFTIDINNMTPKSIDGMIMRYTYDQKCVVIPKIAPFERVIVIAPSDIYDKPLKTEVKIEYFNKKWDLTEYYSTVGDPLNTISQYERVVIKNNSISVLEKGLLDLGSYFNIKPYFRVIDMDKIDK